MPKFGRSVFERLGSDNAAAAYRRFARSSTDAEDARLRQEITIAVIGLLLFLGLVGWALSL
jgi:hypothetical protein